MKRMFIALCVASVAVPLAGCAEGYGYGGDLYAGSPYAYDGYYDGYYGPIYDGYWGTDGYFYYRGGEHERNYRRGDRRHFNRERPAAGNYQSIRGSATPAPGVRMPRFPGARQPQGNRGARGGRGSGGDRERHDRQ